MEHHQRQQRTDAGGRQRRQDGQGMNVALVEDAEHDVDREQGGQYEVGLIVEGLLVHLCGALERAVDARRHADPVHRRLDRRNRRAQRDAGRQIERNRVRDQKTLVVDGQRR